MLAVYFGVVSLISGRDFALSQFATFWYFIVTLALGFGVQVGLGYLKNLVGSQGAAGKVVAVPAPPPPQRWCPAAPIT